MGNESDSNEQFASGRLIVVLHLTTDPIRTVGLRVPGLIASGTRATVTS